MPSYEDLTDDMLEPLAQWTLEAWNWAGRDAVKMAGHLLALRLENAVNRKADEKAKPSLREVMRTRAHTNRPSAIILPFAKI